MRCPSRRVTRLPLNAWYHAMYLILLPSKGSLRSIVPSNLGCNIGRSAISATRIRAMLECGDKTSLAGLIEADEAYAGGTSRPPARQRSTRSCSRGSTGTAFLRPTN
jgi:hypothetical protein